MKAPIYMDNHATTPIDPRVLEAMMPYLTTAFGNAAAPPTGGRPRRRSTKRGAAALLGATSAEIVFTSGATESNTLAIIGSARHYREKGAHVVTCATEHKAVLDSCRELEREGFRVTVLAPDSTGQVSAEQVAEALTEQTVLVTLMLANNEIGTVHRLRAIAAVCRARSVLVHTDAVQESERFRSTSRASASISPDHGAQDLRPELRRAVRAGPRVRSRRSSTAAATSTDCAPVP
jgi:cysteine desulfurase